jgi:flavin-dependent dehydrogenase
LRDAVLREPRIEIVAARAEALLVKGAEVVGVSTSGGELRAPLTVDAMGRTSRAPRWLADAGIAVAEESHEVGIAYYSRYYRLLGGLDFPASAHPFGPRGDLGYALYASFLGDNRTFAIALMVPTGDSGLKAVKDPERHHAACAAIPELADWVSPDVSEPVTGVSAMGALRTTWRAWDEASPRGFVAVADAFCHTDPSFALGLSLALIHGFALADAYAGGSAEAFWAAVTPELRERFEFARDVAAVRLARLRGEEPPVLEAARTFADLNTLARLDADVFRIAFGRIGFLDRLGPLDDAIQDRLAALPPTSPPQAAVARKDLLAAISSA